LTLAAGIDAAKLSVLLDLRHPFSYLAFRPTVALAESLGIRVNWLPLEAPPLKAPSAPGPDDDRGIRHRRARALAIAREIETYAAAQGLVVRDAYREGPADAANLAWLWLRDRQPDRLEAFLAELLRSYWASELDPAKVAPVAGVLAAVGAEATGFAAWASGPGPAAAEAVAAELRERGLFGVPAFLVEDQVFYGRQHLPMIRWILEGRRGPGPI